MKSGTKIHKTSIRSDNLAKQIAFLRSLFKSCEVFGSTRAVRDPTFERKKPEITKCRYP